MDNKDNQEQSNGPAFKPAKNPFLSAIGFNSENKEQPDTPQALDVEVGNKPATLVGTSAEDKSPAGQSEQSKPVVPEEVLYQWQAPEFSYTQKPVGWYIGIFVFFIALSILAYFFIGAGLQKWITIGLLIVMAIALSVWANRKPKILSYSITNHGIAVNNKRYYFDDFKAFYGYMDYNQPTLDLVPSKRFGTLVSLPLATPESDDIQETIAHMVPEIEHKEDLIDRVARRMRF